MNEQYRRIALAQLRESPTNPRRRFAEQPLKELAESITQHGVLQAILTRQHPSEPEAFEIVCGSRRFRASTLAKVADVPAIVRDLTDAEVIAIQAIENIQREDVHPLEEAQSYRALLALGQEVAAIAAKVGKSETYIYQRVKLLDLCPEAQEAFFADKYGTAHAIELARLPEAAQRELLDWMGEGGEYGDGATLADLRAEIERGFHLDLHRACFKKSDAQLVPEAGACTTCQKRTGFVPALFPDIKKKDTCTDRACFSAKLAAFIERTRATLAKDGANVPLLSPYYGQPRTEGALSHNQWTDAKKKCKHTLTGIVVEGAEVGTTLAVCIEPSCSVHRAKGSAASVSGSGRTRTAKAEKTPQELAAERKKAAKRAACERAIVAVVRRTKALIVTDLKTIAKAFITEMWHESTKVICKSRGWEPKKTKYGSDLTDAAHGFIDKMDGVELAGFLIECVMRGRYVANNFGQMSEAFAAEVKRHGVDLAQLEKDALAEITEKAKARAKPKTVKAATPKAKTKRKAA